MDSTPASCLRGAGFISWSADRLCWRNFEVFLSISLQTPG